MSDEDLRRKVDDLHRFFMSPRAPGKKTRAEELDDLLASVRAGKAGTRILLWTAGAVVALSTAWAQLAGYFR